MDRRDILKLGAATALTGCASARAVSFRAIPAPPAMSSTEVDGVLADLDATLDNMAKSSFTPDHLAHLDTLDARRVARGHDLTMRTLAAMHVAATFRELPPEAQTRPDVQQRMWGLLPALDNTMLDMADYLGSLGSAEKRELQERLRRKPSLAMDAIGVLDEHASGVGVSGRRRAQMRAIAAHASWRMTRQSVDALLGETLDKVERVKERHGRDEQVQRAIVAKVAEAQLFERHQGPAHAIFAMATSPEQHEHRVGRANTLLGVGGVLLGLGAAAAIGGVVMLSSATNGDIGGAFVVTAGAVLGLAGLIVLIIGAAYAVSAANDDIVEME